MPLRRLLRLSPPCCRLPFQRVVFDLRLTLLVAAAAAAFALMLFIVPKQIRYTICEISLHKYITYTGNCCLEIGVVIVGVDFGHRGGNGQIEIGVVIVARRFVGGL